MIARLAQLLSLSLLVIGTALPAFATTSYPSYFGPNISFTGIQETSSFGDPEPACCFGAPTGSLNQLIFLPPNFTATATGASGSDSTGAQLQLVMTATTPSTYIDLVLIDEFGDASLVGPSNAGTGVFAGMSGFLTVLEVNGAPVSPTVIGFNAGSGVNGSMSPAAVGSTGLDRINHPGTTLWSGHVAVNVAAIVPNATKVALSWDNDLFAYTQAGGNTAKIQKKVVDGPATTITVIPEPGTAALFGIGLLGLSLRARSRRSS
jgi:hypothetical protein